MTAMLTKAVEKGTAKSIFTPNIKLAGKLEPQDLRSGNRTQQNIKQVLQDFSQQIILNILVL